MDISINIPLLLIYSIYSYITGDTFLSNASFDYDKQTLGRKDDTDYSEGNYLIEDTEFYNEEEEDKDHKSENNFN